MIPSFQWPEPKGVSDQKLIADVQDYGCHVLRVFNDDDRPGFAYSIGLFLNYGQPEVIIFGLPPDRAHTLINSVCELAREGQRFVSGDRTDQLIDGYDACFIAVDHSEYAEHFGYALWFYRSLSEPFPAVQLVWPDRTGKFPWDRGCDASLRPLQPLLARLA